MLYKYFRKGIVPVITTRPMARRVLNSAYENILVPEPTDKELRFIVQWSYWVWWNFRYYVDVRVGDYMGAWLEPKRVIRGIYLNAQGNSKVIGYDPDFKFYTVESVSEREAKIRRKHIVTITYDYRLYVNSSEPDEDLAWSMRSPRCVQFRTGVRCYPYMTKHMLDASLLLFRRLISKEPIGRPPLVRMENIL